MGVELGPSGVTGAISAAPVVISLGNGLEFGPALGIADIGPIVKEGPVGPGLETTVPYIIGTSNLIEQLVSQPSAPLVIREAEAVASAAWEPSLADVISEVPAVFQTALSDINLDPDINTAQEQLLVIPQAESLIVPGISPLLEEQTAPSVSSQPIPQEQEVEEEVLEKVVVENPKEELEEEEEVETRKYVEDEEVSSQRKYEIKEAVIKAKAEASKLGLKKIAGWLVAKFLPAEHEGNRSQIVKKKGPDGSYQETLEAIAGAGELESEEKAINRFNGIVAEKKPVKVSKEGSSVAQEDVARVFRYRFIKSSAPQEVVVKRILKKKVPQPLEQVIDTKVETTLEDYPALAEVFQKAA